MKLIAGLKFQSGPHLPKKSISVQKLKTLNSTYLNYSKYQILA